MPSIFRNFLEIGRVVVVNNGPAQGKLAVVVDVIDQNRALLDGPESLTGFPRMIMNYKDISVTKILVPSLARGASTSELEAAAKTADIVGQYKNTLSSKIAERRQIRSQLTDFDRHKVEVIKAKRNRLVRKVYTELKKKSDEKRKVKIQKQQKAARKVELYKKVKARLSFARLARKKSLKAVRQLKAAKKAQQ